MIEIPFVSDFLKKGGGGNERREREAQKWAFSPVLFFVTDLRMLEGRGPHSSIAQIQNLPSSVSGSRLEHRGPRLSAGSCTRAWLPVPKF